MLIIGKVMFEKFPKMTRFSHGWTVTEKIDGTNAQVVIEPKGCVDDLSKVIDTFNGHHIMAGSRSRFITPEDDNFGFGRWVLENTEDLINVLGPGRHYGEWYGSGINRGYGLKEKRFALFNTYRWASEPPQIDRVDVVPLFLNNEYLNDMFEFERIMRRLKADGSLIAPGFMNPEGIIMFHRPSGTGFKKTFEYDEYGKWMENNSK